MDFKRVERKDYIEANQAKGEFTELLKKKCDICKEREWTSEVKSDDAPSFDCLVGFGCHEGSAFVCDECFKTHFEQHSWNFDELFV